MRIGKTWQPAEGDPRNLLLRPFDGSQNDLVALATIRNDTLRPITPPDDFSEMGAEEISRFYNRPPGFELVDNAWLLFLEKRPAAAAVVYPRAFFHDRPPGNFDLYVVPAVRRHGLGSRLLSHVEQAAIERGHRSLETTIAAEDKPSASFLASRGFNVVGQSAHMSRAANSAPPKAVLPEGFSIVSLQDLGESPDLYRETANRLGAYDLNYSLLTPEEMEHIATTARWEPSGVLFLLDVEGRIVGAIRASGASDGQGYLHEIRLEPTLRGSGLGSAMLGAALNYLDRAGVKHVDLDTSGDNTAAHGLALKAGFTVTQHRHHFLRVLSHVT